jgi:hypothetical protein
MEQSTKTLKNERRFALLPLVAPSSRVYSLLEACDVLNTSKSTMLRLLAAGDIKGFKLPNTQHGRWHIAENAIAAYITARTEEVNKA